VENARSNPYRLDDLLRFMVQQEASDLHLKPMPAAAARLKGKLIPLKAHRSGRRTGQSAARLLTERQAVTLDSNLAVEFGYSCRESPASAGRSSFSAARSGRFSGECPSLFPRWTMGLAGSPQATRRAAPGAGADHRPDGIGKVVDPGRSSARDHRQPAGSRGDDRGPDRVPAHRLARRRHTARGRGRHPHLRRRLATPSGRIPT